MTDIEYLDNLLIIACESLKEINRVMVMIQEEQAKDLGELRRIVASLDITPERIIKGE